MKSVLGDHKEFLTYLIVGALTAVIYFGLMTLCIEVAGFDYRIGVSIAYVAAVSFHFFANRKATFKAENSGALHQGLRYVAVLIVNYVITILVVYCAVDLLRLSAYFGAALSILITVGTGYFASKFWVFAVKGY